MIRILTFEPDNPRHVLYRMLIEQAVLGRGSKTQDAQHKPSKEDRRAEDRIFEQLYALSIVDEEMLEKWNAAREAQGADPLKAPDDSLEPDPRPKTLNPDGGVMRLQQKPDFDLLVKYVEETAWQSQFSRLSVALEGWLSAAEKDESEQKPEATKPTRVKGRAA